MTTNSARFAEFMMNIRPTDSQQETLRDGHALLRERLAVYEPVKDIVVSTFLQGSYRRSTAVRPTTGRRADVDIVVVTKLHEAEWTPHDALALFEGFAKKYYPGKYRLQGRSIGIELSNLEMDIVVTSAPTEATLGALRSDAVTTDDTLEETHDDWRLNDQWVRLSRRADGNAVLLKEAATIPEWKLQPLRIPNRDAKQWEDTHPLEQLRWTREKNKRTSTHFINVVKAIKWWRYVRHDAPGHPRSYPLERIISEYCPDGIDSIAEGVTRTLEAIESHGRTKPFLVNYGTSEDVLKRVTRTEYEAFFDEACEAAHAARAALDESDGAKSAHQWRELFQSSFPEPPKGKSGGGFTPRADGPSNPGPTRYA